MSKKCRKQKRRTVVHSVMIGIDRLIGGYCIELPSGVSRDTTLLRTALEGFLGEEFSTEPTGYRLAIRTPGPQQQGLPRSLQHEFLYIPKWLPSKDQKDPATGLVSKVPGNIRLYVLGDLSCVREVASQEARNFAHAERLRLEDFYRSFPQKRKGGDDNKLPVNAMNPLISPRSFSVRQWAILRRLDHALDATVQSLLPVISQHVGGKSLRVQPFIRRLEIAQDVYFKTPATGEPPSVFERLAFGAQLLQANLQSRSRNRLFTRYTRALTEFNFAQSPVRRVKYRRRDDRETALRSSMNYTASAITSWIEKQVVPSVYFSSPKNMKDKFPDQIPLHAYPRLYLPDGTRSDLLRVEPRFLNRAGKTGQGLIDLIRHYHRGIAKLLPRETDYELIQTQRPLVLHRLLDRVCRTVGLKETDFRTLCKGGSIRSPRKRIDFGEFNSFFETRGRSR